MRDIALTLIVFGSIPFVLKRPLIGLLMWVWLSIMNPHRLAYGFAFSMPFAQIIAICTLFSLLLHARSLYRFPFNAAVFALFGFTFWICVSALFPIVPSVAGDNFQLWLRAIKILAMVLVAFFVVGAREDIDKLVWVLTMSVAFYGIKGGFFVVATAGDFRVWGPPGSYIEENNALAIALLATIPLLRYLQLQASNKWMRWGLIASMLLCFASAVGSYSRGALIAMVAMGAYFWLKGRQKLLVGVTLVIAAPIIFSFMPDKWFDRMSTIQTFDEDRSAQGRINAWWNAWNLAIDRFPIGGGFDIYVPQVFARYSPIPEYVHAAHSIYFQVLGEHGFVGLALYLLIFGSAWRYGGWVVSRCKKRPDLAWAHDLGAMIQVSLIAFAVGAAFLSLAYYDFPYYVAVIAAALRHVVARALKDGPTDKVSPAQVESAVPSANPRMRPGLGK